MLKLCTFTLFAMILMLTACAITPQKEKIQQGQGNQRQWLVHKQQISAINSWQLAGKIGLRTPEESGSATLFWLQQQDYFDIRLSGPLGRGATRLHGHPGKVSLEVAGQGSFQAKSPEAILKEQVGWQLPVSHLTWWIRGLPSPDSRSHITLDKNSRLAQLEQDGWKVSFTSYTEQGDYWLPKRIKVEGQDIQATLAVTEWNPRVLGK